MSRGGVELRWGYVRGPFSSLFHCVSCPSHHTQLWKWDKTEPPLRKLSLTLLCSQKPLKPKVKNVWWLVIVLDGICFLHAKGSSAGGGNKDLIFCRLWIFLKQKWRIFTLTALTFLFLGCFSNFAEEDYTELQLGRLAHVWGDYECAVKPSDQGPGAVSTSLWPRVCPGLTPLPSRVQPELPPQSCTNAWPPEWPKVIQTSEGTEYWGAAGAQEEDQ